MRNLKNRLKALEKAIRNRAACKMPEMQRDPAYHDCSIRNRAACKMPEMQRDPAYHDCSIRALDEALLEMYGITSNQLFIALQKERE